MTTDLLPKSRRLICASACPRELGDFAQWLSTEGYTAAPIHIHLIYLAQALARLARPDDPGPRRLAEVDRAFAPRGGPPTRKIRFEAVRRAYVRFLRAHKRLIEPTARDRFASLRRDYERYLAEVRGLAPSSRSHHAHSVADFLVRGAASRSLGALTPRDVEAFVVLRSRELSRHSHAARRRVPARVPALLLRARRAQCASRRSHRDTPRVHRGELPPRALPW